MLLQGCMELKRTRRAVARFGGPDIAAKIWDVIEAKRADGKG